ncbi:MAG: response regulator transcription factor [Candidatus Dormibacteraeota bacterium]|uniref:Response regulator transcription factor n=1 Tax=Candidatus Amunia macphersoniae TaxID=3127014 RepID=A0A934KH59_9BACT|nr:response regulator transcription factor [Candidatus Dormibacteraeota bacterium]
MVVDDETGIRDFISLGLRHEGFEVETAADGHAGLRAVDDFKPHLVIVDLMMPRLDGWEMCKAIAGDRSRGVIILSARDETGDRIQGLELGADDYLVKPFDFGELLARIRAVLRRRNPSLARVVRAGDLSIDTATREVTAGDRLLSLSAREFDLLLYLAVNADQVLPRQRILDEVWGFNFFGDENNVEVYVRYLRQKLDDVDHQRIQTVRGVGYRLHAVAPSVRED